VVTPGFMKGNAIIALGFTDGFKLEEHSVIQYSL
jgi:hypothetical protein